MKRFFSKKIRQIMKFRGLRQADLARGTGIGQSSISRLVSGEIEPKKRHLLAISHFLNVSVDSLIDPSVGTEEDRTASPAFEFSERTRALSQKLKLQLSDLPELTGISQAILSGCRTGAIPISEKTWRKLEAAELKAGIFPELKPEPQAAADFSESGSVLREIQRALDAIARLPKPKPLLAEHPSKEAERPLKEAQLGGQAQDSAASPLGPTKTQDSPSPQGNPFEKIDLSRIFPARQMDRISDMEAYVFLKAYYPYVDWSIQAALHEHGRDWQKAYEHHKKAFKFEGDLDKILQKAFRETEKRLDEDGDPSH